MTVKKNWRDSFIEELRAVPNVSAAAKVAGVSRAQVYKARSTSDTFKAAWDDAIDESVDIIEANAIALAAKDYQFASMILRRYRKEYREALQTVRAEHGGLGGGPIRFEFVSPENFSYGETIKELTEGVIDQATDGPATKESSDDFAQHAISEILIRGDGETMGQVDNGGELSNPGGE